MNPPNSPHRPASSHAKNKGVAETIEIVHATADEHVREVRALIAEYAASLTFSLDFQGFAQEIDTLQSLYAPPDGRLLLALVSGRAAGCVALRRLDEEQSFAASSEAPSSTNVRASMTSICEMKRLYVNPEFRGKRFAGKTIGTSLVVEVLKEAQKVGYKKMRLDTVPAMKRAIALYKAFGFREIPPYCFNPFPDAIFMELDLVLPA
jgi:putative acetyltransferase